MAEGLFYMRVRGKVSGPFDVATLQKLVKRGGLSRIHEISSDRSAWSAAGEFEDLFPSTPVQLSPQPPPVVESTAETTGGEPQITTATAPAEILYFYAQRGSTVGPVRLSVLTALAENGTLRKDDLVWREHADTGAPAAQLPALAAIFSGHGSGRPLAYIEKGSGESHSAKMQAAISSVAVEARWVGVAVGLLVFLLVNLPWFIADKKIVCWWDLYQAPDGNTWACFATVLVLSAITLGIVALSVTGIARGIIYLSLMAATWIFLCVAMMNSGATLEGVASLILSVVLSLLTGVCAFRSSTPESAAGRVLLGICSGIVTLGMLTAIIETVLERNTFVDVPAGMITGGILIFVGLLSGLAAGIMGFVGLKPVFTAALNQATRLTSLVGLLLPGLGIFVAMSAAAQSFMPRFSAGNGNTSQWNWIFIEVVCRMLLIFYACNALTSVGIQELLTAAQARPAGR